MSTRESASLVVGILGGTATVINLGALVTVSDVLISVAASSGITYGVVTVIMKSQKSQVTDTVINSNSQVPTSSSDGHLHEMTEEIRVFLGSLKPAPSEKDGWYPDPALLFRMRYFNQGEWTLAVVDSDTEIEKIAAISQFLPHLHEANEHTDPQMVSRISEQTETQKSAYSAGKAASSISQTVDNLERLARLRESQMITEEEYLLLKQQVI